MDGPVFGSVPSIYRTQSGGRPFPLVLERRAGGRSPPLVPPNGKGRWSPSHLFSFVVEEGTAYVGPLPILYSNVPGRGQSTLFSLPVFSFVAAS